MNKRPLSARMLLLIAGLSATQVLFAHNTLKRTVPADQAVLPESPAYIELDFSDETYLESVTLTNAAGVAVTLENEPSPERASRFSVPLPLLAPGTYRVAWEVEGDDTHRINGQFSFTLQAAPRSAR